MSLFIIVGIFFLLWWLVFFIVLPIKVTTYQDKNIVIKGIPSSAPVKTNLLFKLLVTSIITIVIMIILVIFFNLEILTMNEILKI